MSELSINFLNKILCVSGLDELRLRFAHSLNHDVLWSHCVMECLSYWQSNKEVCLIISAMFSMTNLLLETAKDNLAYTQNTFIMALSTRNDRA